MLSSAAWLDQLQHLGGDTTGPSLAVESLENQLGRIGHSACIRGTGGLIEQPGGLIQKLLTRRRFHNGQRRPSTWDRH